MLPVRDKSSTLFWLCIGRPCKSTLSNAQSNSMWGAMGSALLRPRLLLPLEKCPCLDGLRPLAIQSDNAMYAYLVQHNRGLTRSQAKLTNCSATEQDNLSA